MSPKLFLAYLNFENSDESLLFNQNLYSLIQNRTIFRS